MYSSDEAKMTGMTPAWLILSGMYVDVPPYIRRPIIRLAYWIGIRRCACSISATKAMMATPMISTSTKTYLGLFSQMSWSWPGTTAMIWVKIITDMPLPTPLSVISSPSHMITAVPAVMMMTIVVMVNTDGLGIREAEQPGISWPARASAMMPVDCRIARPTVRYRVYCVILA